MSDLIASHIKAILFDHDDTLVATIEAKWAQHKHIARIYYGKTLHDEELREHWGKPLRVLAGLLYGTDDIETAMSHIQKTHHDFPKKLHDDTIATLQALHATSMKIGVITATSRSSFDFDMQHMGFPKDLIDYVQTEEDTQFHKPDPRVFEPTLAWLKRNSMNPSKLYMSVTVCTI